MRIQLRDIEAETGKNVRAVIVEVLDAASPAKLSPPKAALVDLFKAGPLDRPYRRAWVTFLLALPLYCTGGFALAFLLSTLRLGPAFVAVFVLAAVIHATTLYTKIRRVDIESKFHELTAPALIEMTAPNKTGQAYGQLIRTLMRGNVSLDESTQRDLLQQANTLMSESRRIAGKQTEIDEALSGMRIGELEAERDSLAQRLAATVDVHARETQQATLALFDIRLQQARRLIPLQERLDAEQEIIYQSLAAAHLSLAGLAFAGEPETSMTDHAAPLSAVSDAVGRIQRETAAVEQAMQEVARARKAG